VEEGTILGSKVDPDPVLGDAYSLSTVLGGDIGVVFTEGLKGTTLTLDFEEGAGEGAEEGAGECMGVS